MRSPRPLALAVVLLLVALPAAHAGDAPTLPTAPLEKAAVGDWVTFALEMIQVRNGEHTRLAGAIGFRVSEATADAVTLEPLSATPAQRSRKAHPLSFEKKAPALATLLQLGNAAIEDVHVVDERRKVGEREVACKKWTFTARRKIELRASPSIEFTDRWTVWTSAEVPAPGLVAYTTETHSKGGGMASEDGRTRLELVGYGQGETATWGKKVTDIEMTRQKLPPPAATPLATNPFADAKVGDWEALTLVTTTKSHLALLERPAEDETRVDRRVTIITVTAVTDDRVTFTAETRLESGQVATGTGVVARREAPSVEAFLDFKPGELANVTQEDEPYALDGRRVVSKKVGCDVDRWLPIGTKERPHWGRLQGKSRTWVSAEVKGRGLVASVMDLEGSGMNGTIESHTEISLVGYGDAEKVLFGKKPEPVEAPKDEPSKAK